MTRRPKDIASSAYNRLLQRSRSRGEDFQLTLQRYAVERLLCRLEASPYQAASSSRAPCSICSGVGKLTGPPATSISSHTDLLKRSPWQRASARSAL